MGIEKNDKWLTDVKKFPPIESYDTIVNRVRKKTPYRKLIAFILLFPWLPVTCGTIAAVKSCQITEK